MSTPYEPGQYPTAPAWGVTATQAVPPTVPATPVPPRPGPRRPGWLAVGASSLLAAVLASGITVGALNVIPHPDAAVAAAARTVVQADPSHPDWTATAAAASPSVVSIQVSSAQGTAEGSGVIWDAQGHIVTNHHVAAALGADAQIQVTLANGQVHQASVVGSDVSTDLAVLQLQDAPRDLTPITVGDSAGLRVGAPVMALGNPLGLSETVTTGIVSALDRPVITQQSPSTQQAPSSPQALTGQRSEESVTSAIQTNAAINPGNSGGALVDAEGRLIGITSSIATVGRTGSGESGNIGIGFAIPVAEVGSVVDQLLARGTVQHAWLGVATTDARATTDHETVIGAGVESVAADSPASHAGLDAGDVITMIDGHPINGAQALMAFVRSQSVGQQLAVSISRNGVTREVTLELAPAAA